jgi:hypothetical protein
MKRTIREQLTEVRDRADFQTARFDRLEDSYPIVLNSADEVDRFIKDRIRLWFRSWIVGPIDLLLDEMNRRAKKVKG